MSLKAVKPILRVTALFGVVIACTGLSTDPIYGSTALLREATEPRTIDSFGFWTLPRLGFGPIVFTDVRTTAKYSVPYVLEANARQGPKNWYQIRLHSRALFGKGTGRAYLFASHNGYASALIKYETKNVRGVRRVVRSTVSYIDGASSKTLRATQDELRFRNYLQYKGVSPGLNELRFSVEVHGSLEVKRIQILSDSGIEYTPQGPARLKLIVRPPAEPPRKGRKLVLTVEVRNVGERLLRDATVQLEYPQDDLRVAGSDTRRLGTLPAGSQRRISFAVVPLHRRLIVIGVRVSGAGGNQSAISRTLNVR